MGNHRGLGDVDRIDIKSVSTPSTNTSSLFNAHLSPKPQLPSPTISRYIGSAPQKIQPALIMNSSDDSHLGIEMAH